MYNTAAPLRGPYQYGDMETVPAGLTSHRDRHPGHGIGQSCWKRVSGQSSLLTYYLSVIIPQRDSSQLISNLLRHNFQFILFYKESYDNKEITFMTNNASTL